MSTIRFRAGDVDLELAGSEPFVRRQLLLLAPYLGRVDIDALNGDPAPVDASPPADATAAEHEAQPEQAVGEPAAPTVTTTPPPVDPRDELHRFYTSFPQEGKDRQADAALIFAYYLQRKEGLRSLELRHLIRCCIRAGVDTRNFNRTLGTLTRRGLLETVRPGHDYRLSEQGLAAVESRMA